MQFRAKIKPLQGAEKSPYKDDYPHPQNAIQAKFKPLQSIAKQKATRKPQHRTENTAHNAPKTLYKLRKRPPHISERPHKKKTPHRAKNALQGIKKSRPRSANRERHFLIVFE